MVIRTFQGQMYEIHYQSKEDNCYWCEFPHWLDLSRFVKFNDIVMTNKNGNQRFYCGSLERLMGIIAHFTSQSEC